MGFGVRAAAPHMIGMFDRPKRLRLLLLVLVMLSLTVISLDFRSKGDGPIDKLGGAAVAVFGPVQDGLATIFRPVGNFFAGFTQVPSLRSKVADLERQQAALLVEREQVEDITRENERLRKLLGLRDRYDLRTTSAQVIGVSPSNFQRIVYIDRGSDDGIREDMPVIGGEGLAGRVVKVAKSTAEVLLIVDRSSAVAARIASTGETGVLEGTGQPRVRFELLDPEAKVAVGDQIVTSGYDRGLFPPGIPLGRVIAAPPSNANLSRVVTVEPYVDFSSLDHVLLVTGRTRGGAP